MNFFSENLKLFKRVALPLFLLVVLSSNIDQYLNLKIEAAIRDLQGGEKLLYVFGFLSILSSVIFPVLLTVTALYAVSSYRPLALPEYIKKNLNQVFIEMLRAWGKTLLWSLLLIIPGLWKYLEYTFVPYVVTSSRKYNSGELDALKESARIVRLHVFKVLGVLVVFHLFIPVTLAALFDGYRLLWETPVQSLILNVVDTYLLLVSVQILFSIFKNEVSHDAHV